MTAWTGAGAQGVLALLAVVTLAFYPPIHGRMLLVPIDGQQVSASVLGQLMLFEVGDGPLPGSVVVDGPGRKYAGSLLRVGIIPLGAPPALCSSTTSSGDVA